MPQEIYVLILMIRGSRRVRTRSWQLRFNGNVNILLFGATGMVGQGVLRECLLDPEVESVRSVGRGRTGLQDPKLQEIVHGNFLDFSAIEDRLGNVDACFFCLGVSSVGMSAERYREITYDYTMAAARTLARLNPGMTFIYVSGMGTDGTERGRSDWARVKGKTENDLIALPFRAYAFRPGMIVPVHGERPKSAFYRWFYAPVGPLLPWLYRRFPKYATTTEQMGRAMLKIAKRGPEKRVLENADINRV
jgi:uncharacterized protein YbjT (DUF2867 family)